MMWVFERKGEQMRCEIRREGAGSGYEMILTSPDGSQRMERFDETSDLIKRTLDLQRDLLETGWRQPTVETRPRSSPSVPAALPAALRTAGSPEN